MPQTSMAMRTCGTIQMRKEEMPIDLDRPSLPAFFYPAAPIVEIIVVVVASSDCISTRGCE